MAHLALYRKYRPKTFEEMVGQEAVVTALQNQVKFGQIGHAYLFCGTRGTGKTSAAKVFARAVNCLHPVDGNPCNECELCREAESGFNTVEIDAASNNGVESMRDLREEVQYTPPKGRYKVYIIDEAHMITPAAFNALLKTLEEPPAHAIFILATTEPHKILSTIVSRCQRYDFKRIPTRAITKWLRYVCDQERIEADDGALQYIAALAEGGMRDALSILDQCHAYYMNETISLNRVQETLGAVDSEILVRMTQALIDQDAAALLSGVDEILAQGRDLLQFVLMWNEYLRNMLVSRVLPKNQSQDLIGADAAVFSHLQEQAMQFSTEEIASYIESLAKLEAQIRTASQKRIILEVGLIKLLHLTTEEVQKPLPKEPVKEQHKVEASPKVTLPRETKKAEPVMEQGETVKAKPVTGSLEAEWPKIRQQLMAENGSMAALQFMSLHQGAKEDELVLVSERSIYVQQMQLKDGEKLRRIEQEIEQATGKHYRVTAQNKANGGGAVLSNIKKQINADVNWRN